MIQYRLLDIQTDWPLVAKFVSPILCADTCGIMAHNERGEFKACAVFDSFTVSACNVHMGISSPVVLRHGFLPLVADFVFNYRSRARIFGLTPEDNSKALKFNEHIGMQYVTTIPDAYADGVGYVITRMDKATSPWLAQQREAA